MLKEALEKVKEENIMLNIELNQLKQFEMEVNYESNKEIKCVLLQMKLDLESALKENDRPKLELNSREKRENQRSSQMDS